MAAAAVGCRNSGERRHFRRCVSLLSGAGRRARPAPTLPSDRQLQYAARSQLGLDIKKLRLVLKLGLQEKKK